MNKSELIRNVSKAVGYPQATVGEVIDAMSKEMLRAIQSGEPVEIHGLLKIKVEAKPERAGRNPSTGAEILIPAKNVVKITPAKALTDAANGG